MRGGFVGDRSASFGVVQNRRQGQEPEHGELILVCAAQLGEFFGGNPEHAGEFSREIEGVIEAESAGNLFDEGAGRMQLFGGVDHF